MRYRLFALSLFAAAAGGLGLGLPRESQAQSTQAPVQRETAVFVVDNMTCAACPITVRTAMSHVSGVAQVRIDFARRTATVVYDPVRARPSQIADASRNAGYPARLVVQERPS